ncbi:hypothetical protein PHYPSEUDO_001733 [Phytophthora pseudosyringae]|uniref:RxLR effector protein n=1 Tax=Phytophthora pseudosyringae TaxID=221518 RepID=A0A8T1V4Q8_9STRA|nr:hypothetical protein PHYPSEUDO_001733 [Phytophthora pseudosyringae]
MHISCVWGLLTVTFILTTMATATEAFASDHVALEGVSSHRTLRGVNERAGFEHGSSGTDDEARAFKLPGIDKSVVKKKPDLAIVMKKNPTFAKGLKDPNFSENVKKLQNDRGFMEGLKKNPLARETAQKLIKNPSSVTQKNIEDVGRVALKASISAHISVMEKMFIVASIFCLSLVILGLFAPST